MDLGSWEDRKVLEGSEGGEMISVYSMTKIFSITYILYMCEVNEIIEYMMQVLTVYSSKGNIAIKPFYMSRI